MNLRILQPFVAVTAAALLVLSADDTHASPVLAPHLTYYSRPT